MSTQTATILVTDLVGSTALRGAVGEDRAEALRRAHDRALVEAAEANGGTVVKGLGDGVLVMFAGAAEAVTAGVAMQRAVDLLARQEDLPLTIRVARARCTHPVMAAWLPRIDALERRASETF